MSYAEDKPAQPVRQYQASLWTDDLPNTGRSPAQGCEFCPGGYGTLVSGSSRRRWWRCPSCGWVGFQINTNTPPRVPTHQRPKENSDVR